ncbi:hypothetical protein C7N43_26915 [Sphingobacteriales bacterium UPWRP_1]|nr:hypothetical protein B6N25_03670 [Sphingobacteriales bacterium TSM_CSS]PSJ73885.1 hypothetical protein C7N43_26915 [Sphingobacteriales bacterium UPWRP_1]
MFCISGTINNYSIANAGGWIDVDECVWKSTKFLNVFVIGEAAGTPNAKTGAAIRKQAQVDKVYNFMKKVTLPMHITSMLTAQARSLSATENLF